jgi:hypothetical protein
MISEKKDFRREYREIRRNIDHKKRQKENQEIIGNIYVLVILI